MKTVKFPYFDRNLNSLLEEVSVEGTSCCVLRSKGKDVVVMPLSEYNGMIETLYLLNSPKNAKRLISGIKEFESGNNSGKSFSSLDDLIK